MTPETTITTIAFLIGDRPDELRRNLARIEAERRRWTYRLFAGRWRKELDRRLAAMLRERLETLCH